jgi:hypothetical protein
LRFSRLCILLFLICTLVLSAVPASLMAYTGESPALTLTGSAKAPAVLKNIDFTDVRASNTWAKSAIYESAALELMKGSNRRFGITDILTVEQAIAIGYNAIGREADAQKAAEALDLARAKDARLYPAPRMWSDGYIQLAYNDGILSARDYNDAIRTDQLSLGPDSFFRNASATREDVAYYLGRILGLAPQNAQTRIFNSYSDWNQADPHRIPYIEAMLQNHIMNDDGNGRFHPKAYVTRAEMAQILVNAEPVIFEKLGYKKMKGSVESVSNSQDLSNGQKIRSYVINIRNSGGDLHRLTTFEDQDSGTSKNELTGTAQSAVSSAVVNRGNSLSLAGTLKVGEQIVYFVNADNAVMYIQVISSKTDLHYYLGKVDSVDTGGRKVNFTRYVELPFADIRLADQKTLSNIQPANASTVYSVSSAARVYSNVLQGGLDALVNDNVYVITVNNGVIERFDLSDAGLMEESGLVSGIVKEVNPSLGYITLYFADGSGVSPDAEERLAETRTYSFGYQVTVHRDGKKAAFEDIIPGDYAFAQLDEDGMISRLSSQSYYRPVYGTVHTKTGKLLVVKTANGSFLNYTISPGVPVFRNDRLSDFSQIMPGDTVRLLVQTGVDSVHISRIDLEKTPQLVSAVYRGNVEGYSKMNDSLSLSGVQEFVNGRWEETSFIGIKPFAFSRDYSARPEQQTGGKAYIAVKRDADGQDRIIMAAYRALPQYEITLDDQIMSLSGTAKRLELTSSSDKVTFDAGTIAIRDGRLVDMTALGSLEHVMIAAEKPYAASDLLSHVVVSNTQSGTGSLAVYRGRIKTVEPLKRFTVESFAQMSGVDWIFSNTPKTFDIDLTATRLLEGDGVGNMRDFGSTYVNMSVYVVTQNGKTLLVSTASYAETAFRGRVEALTGGTVDSLGNVLTEPDGIRIKEAYKYNLTGYVWESIPARDIQIPANAVIIKNGQTTALSAVKPGDKVRILTTSAGNDGIIVIVE